MTTIDADSEFRRNPFMRIRFGSPIECDLLLDGRTFELPSPALVAVIAAMTGKGNLAHFADLARSHLDDPAHASAVIDAFVGADILVAADREYPEMDAVEHWIDRGWLDALLFHLRARGGQYADDGALDPTRLQDSMLRDVIAEGVSVWRDIAGPETALPEPLPRVALPPLADVLLSRRSNRPWARESIALRELATVLSHASSETLAQRETVRDTAAERPSALLHSAFSALELYVAAFSVEQLPEGLYHYRPQSHSLTLVRGGDLRHEFVGMCAGQARAGGGSVTIVISAAWGPYMARYQHAHAYRVLLVNAAELGQKILLYATALGLSTFLTPAFDELRADRVMGFHPTQEAAIEAIGLG